MQPETFAIAWEAAQAIRNPASIGEDANGRPLIVFDPALTTAEQATFDLIVRRHLSRIPGITPAEWEQLAPQIDGLRTYLGLANPTAAQTASATKAIIRVLRAIFRD